jgi:hypothetical protein
MKRAAILLSFLISLGFSNFVGSAVACDYTDPVPCKKLRIYNNNPTYGNSINVFFESFIQDPAKADLWMQAQFKVSDWNSSFVSPRRFVTTRLRRAYIKIGNWEGIAPGTFVDITVPFYTQLLTYTPDNLGKVADQFIDWWNSGRIVFFDSSAAFVSAAVTNSPETTTPGGGLPPPPVKVLSGAAVPSCTASNGKTCTVPLYENALQPLDGIPFQLQEYTLASAEGPPLNKTLPPPTRTKIDLRFVNYNVSSLDSVFLPVAMGPLTKAGNSVNLGVVPPVPVPYVGTGLTTAQFRQTLDKFSSNGDNWPFYVPAYYDQNVRAGFPSSAAKACSLAPFVAPPPTTGVYNLPKIPGAFNVLTESYQGIRKAPDGSTIYPPVPPIISSNPADYKTKYTTNACTLPTPAPFVNPPNLGKAGKAFVDLWNTCYPGTGDLSDTCKDIRTVAKLFADGYTKACPIKPTPPFYIMMQAVYGWVPIVNDGCTGVDLKTDVAAYETAALAYCRLQYNYVTLPPLEKAKYTFNPYTALIHAPYSPLLGGGLDSSAYAFSIDDKLSFKSVVADGIILTVAGTKGLEFDKAAGQTAPVPTPIPTTAAQIINHCKLD